MSLFTSTFEGSSRPRDRQSNLSEADRTKVYAMIGHAAKALMDYFAVPVQDIVAGMAIASMLRQGFKHRRQNLNGGAPTINTYASEKHTAVRSPTATTRYLTTSELSMLWQNIAIVYGFSWTSQAEWISCANSILANSACFKARLEELRIGHTQVPTGKQTINDGGVERKEPTYVSTSEYGLSAAHSPMLEGIRYPPDLKSSVASSLGPLTQLIMYYRSTTQAQPDKFSKRWISALKDTYAHLPFMKKMLHTLWNASARDAASIIGAVGDLTLLVGSRQNCKLCFPINFYSIYMEACKDQVQVLIAQQPPTSIRPQTSQVKNISGIKGVCMYAKIAAVNNSVGYPPDRPAVAAMEVEGESGVSVPMSSYRRFMFYDVPFAEELLFHAIFGTYAENLHVVAWITGAERPLHGRKSFDLTQLSQRASKEIMLLKVKRASKMANANQSEFLRDNVQQVSSQPRFSVRTTVECDSVLEYISKSFHGQSVSDTSVGTLVLGIKELTQGIQKEIQKTRKITWGTGKAFEMTTEGDITENEVEAPVFQESFFMTSKDEILARSARI